MQPSRPHVLAIGGLDPAGCAGLDADVVTITQLGGHSSTIATTLTVQTEHCASQSHAVANGLVHAQLRALCEQSQQPPQAIKVGLVKDARHWAAIRRYHQQQPLVIDPVIQASSGANLTAVDRRWQQGFKKLAIDASLITPNTAEWALLKPFIPASTAVLVTGKQSGDTVINQLYRAGKLISEFETSLVAGEFRGTGCRLASAITLQLARQQDLNTAIENAMRHVAEQIKQAYVLGAAAIPAAGGGAE